jgi:DegV family protein with EDD domain
MPLPDQPLAEAATPVQGSILVIDGAVDLPGRLEGSTRMRTVPGEVWIGDELFTGDPREFWALVRSGRYPSTSPPTVSALAEAYRHPDLVYAIHVSAELSATVARAQVAATRSGPGVTIIDTRSLSVGAGLVAAAVHHAVSEGLDHVSNIDLALTLPDRLHTFALVQDVESLRRSDRDGLLPKGRLARNHPMLLSVRGRAVPLEQPKDRGDGLRKLVAHLRHSVRSEIGAWAIGHGDASDCDQIVDQLSTELGQPPSFLACLDPTVGVHVGPEAILVAAISDPVDL